MKKALFLLTLLLAAMHSPVLADGDKNFLYAPAVIAESVPLETSYGSSLTRRAPELWLELFSGAQKSIDIEVFYIDSRENTALAEVLSAIKSAAGRGVKVRIIIDSVFYKKMPKTADELKAVKGIELRVINFGKLGGGIMHAKYFVIDVESVYLGSQNFDWRSLEQIHEVGVLVRNGQLASNFLDVFNLDWQLADNPVKPAKMPAALHPATRQNPVTLSFQAPVGESGTGDVIAITPADTQNSDTGQNSGAETASDSGASQNDYTQDSSETYHVGFISGGDESSASVAAPETAPVSGNGDTVTAYSAISPADFTPKGLDKEITELLHIIASAKKSLKIQVMNFKIKKGKSSWTELDAALRAAAGRGVKVQLIVADWTMYGAGADFIKDLSRTKNIEIKVSAIPQYSKEFVEFARVEHCKYMTADGIYSFVSTSNWEYDYFYKSRNAAIILKGAPIAQALEDVFSIDWNSPYASAVDINREYKAPDRNKPTAN
ncbi:MAG: phospholipase D-like domain-containing protein [Elusimicrobiaceae bacterium]